MYTNMRKAAFCLWAFGLIAGTIVSLLPPHHVTESSNLFNDKVQHLVSYALLAHIACHTSTKWRLRYILCLITFFASVAIEFLQPLTGRSFELMDMVANLGGIALGILMMKIFFNRRIA